MVQSIRRRPLATFFLLAFAITWVFLHTRGSVLLAILLHASTNLFVVSPGAAGSLALPLLAAKWALVILIIAVAGPALAKGPRPEALPRA